jgi:hypothetical protein
MVFREARRGQKQCVAALPEFPLFVDAISGYGKENGSKIVNFAVVHELLYFRASGKRDCR